MEWQFIYRRKEDKKELLVSEQKQEGVKRVKYIDVTSTDPSVNLALEQYVFDTLSKDEDFFLLWQNDNSIIIGKNQNTHMEINSEYVKQNGIKVVRRLSGGGAVYHDLGNLNFTFIVKEGSRQYDFSKFCKPVIKALDKLGVKAEVNGRNDMIIDGKKFSGNAQYFKNGKIMHHGTLMYNSNLEVLSGALQVNVEKIAAKGVKSVKSHVTNIKPYMKDDNIPILEFKRLLLENMFAENDLESYALTSFDWNQISKLAEERYAAWEWNYGKSPDYEIRRQKRYEGCGQIEICMNIRSGIITDFDLFGDFFSYEDKEELLRAIIGSRLSEENIKDRLEGIEVGRFIHNFTKEDLICLLLA